MVDLEGTDALPMALVNGSSTHTLHSVITTLQIIWIKLMLVSSVVDRRGLAQAAALCNTDTHLASEYYSTIQKILNELEYLFTLGISSWSGKRSIYGIWYGKSH